MADHPVDRHPPINLPQTIGWERASRALRVLLGQSEAGDLSGITEVTLSLTAVTVERKVIVWDALDDTWRPLIDPETNEFVTESVTIPRLGGST